MRRLCLLLLVSFALGCRTTAPHDADGLAAMLLVTDDYTTIQQDWRELPAAEAPVVPTVHEARGGDTVTIFIIFTGCAPRRSGVCDAAVDYAILRPDGQPYGEQSSGPLWTGPPPATGNMQLGQAHVELFVELTDPLGDYTIRATIRDRVSGRTFVLEQHLTVKAGAGVKT